MSKINDVRELVGKALFEGLGDHVRRYKDALLIVKEGDTYAIEVSSVTWDRATIEVEPLAVMLSPNAGDTLIYEGETWVVARHNGVHYYPVDPPK